MDKQLPQTTENITAHFEAIDGLRDDADRYIDQVSPTYIAKLAWEGLEESIQEGWLTKEEATNLYKEWFGQ